MDIFTLTAKFLLLVATQVLHPWADDPSARHLEDFVGCVLHTAPCKPGPCPCWEGLLLFIGPIKFFSYVFLVSFSRSSALHSTSTFPSILLHLPHFRRLHGRCRVHS